MDPSKNKNEHETHFDGFSIDDIENNFKKLASELISKKPENLEVLIEEIPPEETAKPVFYQDYIPTVEDYLARAKTNEECLEIINFCLQKGDITGEEAVKLKHRLEKGGPRAFGTRNWGYYTSKN